VVAIMVINLIVVGLLKLMSQQDHQLTDLKKELASHPRLYLRAHEDPLARQLGMPARVSASDVFPAPYDEDPAVELVLLRVERSLEPARLTATFLRQPSREEAK